MLPRQPEDSLVSTAVMEAIKLKEEDACRAVESQRTPEATESDKDGQRGFSFCSKSSGTEKVWRINSQMSTFLFYSSFLNFPGWTKW